MNRLLLFSHLFLLPFAFSACGQEKNAEDHLIRILKDDGVTVYIPTLGDILLLNDSTYMVTSDGMPVPSRDRVELVKAILDNRDMPMETINKLLKSPCANLRVYGYIFYVRNTNDINFEYLKEELHHRDTIFYIDADSYVPYYYYSSDIMLLIALKGVNYSHLLPMHMNIHYGLTNEQKEELYKLYNGKEPMDEYMDRFIQIFFKYDNTFDISKPPAHLREETDTILYIDETGKLRAVKVETEEENVR